MFVGEFRYTLVGFTWSGGEMWRCAIQRCPARCKIAELRGDFNTPVHNHDKQILLQGQIWSEARKRQENYFVVITLKKTIATLYYNTYCYALKDKQQNIWSCFPGPCHALLRIEGDFERVVEEMDHSHDGTLTFIRSDETYASQVNEKMKNYQFEQMLINLSYRLEMLRSRYRDCQEATTRGV